MVVSQFAPSSGTFTALQSAEWCRQAQQERRMSMLLNGSRLQSLVSPLSRHVYNSQSKTLLFH
jgi:hypothetical protein